MVLGAVPKPGISEGCTSLGPLPTCQPCLAGTPLQLYLQQEPGCLLTLARAVITSQYCIPCPTGLPQASWGRPEGWSLCYPPGTLSWTGPLEEGHPLPLSHPFPLGLGQTCPLVAPPGGQCVPGVLSPGLRTGSWAQLGLQDSYKHPDSRLPSAGVHLSLITSGTFPGSSLVGSAPLRALSLQVPDEIGPLPRWNPGSFQPLRPHFPPFHSAVPAAECDLLSSGHLDWLVVLPHRPWSLHCPSDRYCRLAPDLVLGSRPKRSRDRSLAQGHPQGCEECETACAADVGVPQPQLPRAWDTGSGPCVCE